MTSMLMELYDALVSAGAAETKARSAASAVPHGKDLCTRQDLDKGLALTRQGLEKSLAATRQDLEKSLAATRQDLEKSLAATRQDLNEGLSEVRADIKVLKFAVFSMYPFILVLVIKLFFLT